MANVIQCPSCKQQYTLQASLVGKQVKCKKCGNAFLVPGPSTPMAPQTHATQPVAQQSPIPQPVQRPAPFSPTGASRPSGGSARRTPEPTSAERAMANLGFTMFIVNMVAFFMQVAKSGPPGVYTISFCSFLALVAVALIVPRFRHEPLKAIGVGGGILLGTLLMIGGACLGGGNGGARPADFEVAAPGVGNPANSQPSRLRPVPAGVVPTTPAPAPSGQPVTLWNVRAKKDGVVTVVFTAEYRVDQPEALGGNSYIWVIHDKLYELEIPITLDKSGRCGTLRGAGEGPMGMGVTMGIGSMGSRWESQLLAVHGPADKRVVSNTEGVAIGPIRPKTPRMSPEERRQYIENRLRQMAEEHGEENVVTLYFEESPPLETHAYICETIEKITGSPPYNRLYKDDRLWIVVAPCSDVEGLAGQLGLGEVVDSNEQERSATIKFDVSLLPESIQPLPTDPEDPLFIQRNLTALDSTDYTRKSRAIRNFQNAPRTQPNDQVVEAFKQLLENGDSPQQGQAIDAIAVWGSSDVVVEIFAELLQREEYDSKVGQIMNGLAQHETEASAELIARDFLDAYFRAEGLLKKMGPVARTAVAAYLDHEDDVARKAALRVTETIGVAPQAVPTIIAMLAVDDHGLRSSAMRILTDTGDERAIGPVVELLCHPTSHVFAKPCLESFGSAAEDAVAELLTHEDAATRRRAVGLLKIISTEKSIPSLIEALGDEDNGVRYEACSTLEKFDDPRVIQVMAGHLTGELGSWAGRYLTKVGPAAEDAVLEQVNTADRSVLLACFRILKEIGAEKSIVELRRHTRGEDVGVKIHAQQALDAILARRKAAQSES